MQVKIEGNMKEKRYQAMPKRYMVSKHLRTTEGYEINLTFWIPNTPFFKNPPQIGFTISHGKRDNRQYCRIVFPKREYISGFLEQLLEFYLSISEELEKAHKDAINDWERLHKKIEIKEAPIKDIKDIPNRIKQSI